MPSSSAVIRESNPDQRRTLVHLSHVLRGLHESEPTLDLSAAIATVDDLMLRRPVDDGTETNERILELESRLVDLETALAVVRTGLRLADEIICVDT